MSRLGRKPLARDATVLRPFLNIEPAAMYNAKAYGLFGDGVTNDAAAFTALVNTANGTPIYFPAGTYILSGVVSANVTATRIVLRGAGRDASVIKNLGLDILNATTLDLEGLQFLATTASLRAFYLKRDMDRVRVVNCLFDGHNTPVCSFTNFPVIVSRLDLLNNEVKNGRQGFHLEAASDGSHGYHDVLVDGNYIHDLTMPTEAGGGIPHQTAIWINASGDTTVDHTTKSRIIIVNNRVHDIKTNYRPAVDGTGGSRLIAIAAFGRDVTMAHNTVRGCYGYEEDGITAYDYAIEGLYTKAEFFNVSDNIVADACGLDAAILVKGQDSGSPNTSAVGEDHVIANNVITWPAYRTVTDRSGNRYGSTGIRSFASDAIITGNVVRGAATSGIAADYAGKNLTITDNIIRDCGGYYGLAVLYDDPATFHNGEYYNLKISGNQLYDPCKCDAAIWDVPPAFSYCSGIQISASAATQIWANFDISDNTVHIDTATLDTTALPVASNVNGIRIGINYADTSLTGLSVRNNLVNIAGAAYANRILLAFNPKLATASNWHITGNMGINCARAFNNLPTVLKYDLITGNRAADTSATLGAESADRTGWKSQIQVTYDFAVLGGALGTIGLSRWLPAGAIITRAWYKVVTQPSSATNAATISLGVTGATAIMLAATQVSNAAWAAGFHDGIETGAAGVFSVRLANETQLLLNVAGGEVLTGGKFILFIEYAVTAA